MGDLLAKIAEWPYTPYVTLGLTVGCVICSTMSVIYTRRMRQEARKGWDLYYQALAGEARATMEAETLRQELNEERVRRVAYQALATGQEVIENR